MYLEDYWYWTKTELGDWTEKMKEQKFPILFYALWRVKTVKLVLKKKERK